MNSYCPFSTHEYDDLRQGALAYWMEFFMPLIVKNALPVRAMSDEMYQEAMQEGMVLVCRMFTVGDSICFNPAKGNIVDYAEKVFLGVRGDLRREAERGVLVRLEELTDANGDPEAWEEARNFDEHERDTVDPAEMDWDDDLFEVSKRIYADTETGSGLGTVTNSDGVVLPMPPNPRPFQYADDIGKVRTWDPIVDGDWNTTPRMIDAPKPNKGGMKKIVKRHAVVTVTTGRVIVKMLKRVDEELCYLDAAFPFFEDSDDEGDGDAFETGADREDDGAGLEDFAAPIVRGWHSANALRGLDRAVKVGVRYWVDPYSVGFSLPPVDPIHCETTPIYAWPLGIVDEDEDDTGEPLEELYPAPSNVGFSAMLDSYSARSDALKHLQWLAWKRVPPVNVVKIKHGELIGEDGVGYGIKYAANRAGAFKPVSGNYQAMVSAVRRAFGKDPYARLFSERVLAVREL